MLAADEMAAAITKAAADYGGSVGLKTVGGCEFTAMAKDGTLMIRVQGNVADVTIADVQQSNGVIHVIDKVLLPASYRGAGAGPEGPVARRRVAPACGGPGAGPRDGPR